MDDEQLRQAFARIEAGQKAMLDQINTKMDDILDKLAAVRADTDSLKGHLIYTLGDQLTLSQRITKLEIELRGRSGEQP